MQPTIADSSILIVNDNLLFNHRVGPLCERRFADAVAAIVSDCTDSWDEPKPEWRLRKEIYLAKLAAKRPQSLLVSLADKTHNAEAILFDYRVMGDALWDRFNGGAAGTRWYYQSLANIFSDAMPGRLSDHWLASSTNTMTVSEGICPRYKHRDGPVPRSSEFDRHRVRRL
jgi:hypothetical protein